MSDVNERIRQRLRDTKKTYAEASRAAGMSESQISSMLRKDHHSPTIATVQKIAKALETTPEWIAFGLSDRHVAPGEIVVSEDLLRQVLAFVLEHEGVSSERAAALSDILPAALSGPPVDAVEGDAFLTFRVHFQFPGKQYERSEPR